jgi:hypothetical protein
LIDVLTILLDMKHMVLLTLLLLICERINLFCDVAYLLGDVNF